MSARSEAMQRGDKRYRSDRDCPRGHKSERFVSSGRCADCSRDDGQERWATQRGDVLRKVREYRAKNRDKFLSKNRQRYSVDLEASRAKGREFSAKYRKTRKAELKAAKRKHYLAHRAHILERSQRNYQANRDQRKVASAAWAKANSDKTQAASHAYRARKRNAPGRFTPADIDRICALQKSRCAYCRKDLKRAKRHIDHITALVNGGSNHPSNIQLLCQKCNASKQHRDPIYHAQRLGMLL